MAPAQAVGKVLKLAVVKGEILTAGSCIAKGSIDDLLRPGFLAFPAPLPRRSTSVELLYPGCVVDVFATFPLRDHEKGDAVTTPLLQNIQVLAIADETVIPPADEKEAAEITARRRTGSSANVTVTLEVTARQAAALQLALEKGNLGLAMRNPTDKGWNPMEPMVVKEGQLTAASEALDPQTLALVTSLQRILNPETVPDANASQASAGDTTATAQPDPNNLFNLPPLPPPPPPVVGVTPRKSTVPVTIIRGQKVEEIEVEKTEQEQEEKDESLQEVGG
jgi:Flp pilus assembly protein CpaB